MSFRSAARAPILAVTLASGCVLPCSAAGAAELQAGVAVAVHGMATIRHRGEESALAFRDAVHVGDTISTATGSVVQLRMNDGALINLQPQSNFTIWDYVALPQDAAQAPAGEVSTHIALELLAGALRTVTSSLYPDASRKAPSYKLETPIATIGIRGTDYAVAVCTESCGADGAGLHAGVFDGAIELSNAAGHMTLLPGEFAIVPDAHHAPQRLRNRPEALAQDTTDDMGLPPALSPDTGGRSVAELQGIPRAGEDQPLAAAPIAGAGYAGSVEVGDLAFDSAGALQVFSVETDAGREHYRIGSAANVETGSADTIGLRWGRWSDGTALIEGTSPQALDLDERSLHWITTVGAMPSPTLPLQGFASFSLIGATSPTDEAGHSGTLGQAELVADFDRQVVFSALTLDIDGHHWHADGTAPLDGSAVFAATYDHVVVDLLHPGSGSFAGFFAGNATALSGAGLSYVLTQGETNVTGVAAFAIDQHSGRRGGP